MLAKTNALVCLLFSDSGLYHSSGSLSFQRETDFFSSCSKPPPFLCQCIETVMGSVTQPLQPSSLQTGRQINEDTESTRAEGLGVLLCSDMDQL